MSPQELQNQIAVLTKKVQDLERNEIQLTLDPTISLYLSTFVLTFPTQTYSTTSPSGGAPTGSIWFRDTGVLATREIHMYSGSAWVQFQ